MGHQTMLNPGLEDHTGGNLGYLNSLFTRLFCFGQEPTPDIRNNIYFRHYGLAAFFGDTLVTMCNDCKQCVLKEGREAETSEINIVSNIWSWFLTKTK